MTQVLAVDLDGTLVRSDLLYETFWSALGRDWANLPRMVGAGVRGRGALKAVLAGQAAVDVTTLPYNPEVLAHLTRRKAEGDRLILVTGSDQSLAEQVAAHLDLFDEVHGSTPARNLKGAAKAAFLSERFGEGGFAYMGDARVDLAVWQAAGSVITVAAGRDLRARAEALGKPTEHLDTTARPLSGYLRALRPHQWLKNILVFLPMLTAHHLDAAAIWQSLLAFVAFSLIASGVYVLNDLFDLSADRAHPRKRHRPFASGAVPIAHGSILGLGLFLAGLGVSLTLGLPFFGIMILYFGLTSAYSLALKRRTIIDIWVLSLLYSLRILAGSAATGIVPSVWLVAFSIFFFFSLAAVKRQAELVDLTARDEQDVRRRGYHRDDLLLIAMMAIASGYVSVLVLALYIRTPFVDQLYAYPPALLGICLVLLYWISRIVMVTHRGQMEDDPLIFAVRDRVSQICLLTILAFALIGTFAGGIAPVIP